MTRFVDDKCIGIPESEPESVSTGDGGTKESPVFWFKDKATKNVSNIGHTCKLLNEKHLRALHISHIFQGGSVPGSLWSSSVFNKNCEVRRSLKTARRERRAKKRGGNGSHNFSHDIDAI